MRVPRIELALTVSMLLIGASRVTAQPTHYGEMAAVAAVEIAQASASGGEGLGSEGLVKVRKIEGGMSWAEVTIVRALLAGNVEREPGELIAPSNGTRAPTGG